MYETQYIGKHKYTYVHCTHTHTHQFMWDDLIYNVYPDVMDYIVFVTCYCVSVRKFISIQSLFFIRTKSEFRNVHSIFISSFLFIIYFIIIILFFRSISNFVSCVPLNTYIHITYTKYQVNKQVVHYSQPMIGQR